jgi:uncharacterized membrane protein SirB2
MRTTLSFRFTTVFLALLSLTLVVFGVLNFEQRRVYQLPDDGVSWVDTKDGVVAWIVAPDSPAERGGISQGDYLGAINGRPVKNALDATREIFRTGVWAQARYDLTRNGQAFQTQVVVAPQSNPKSLRHYLELVGLIYLLIGTFILVRRWTAPKSLHFYVFCLASFVLYTFSYTGKLNLFDGTIYWLNALAWILQPALFLHFCLSFPERPEYLRERPVRAVFIYMPGALLMAVHVLVATGFLLWSSPLLLSRIMLDRIELFYLATYFLLGAFWLWRSYRRAEVPQVKQQLKWVARGTFLAIVPFALCYVLPFFLGFVPTPWMKL